MGAVPQRRRIMMGLQLSYSTGSISTSVSNRHTASVEGIAVVSWGMVILMVLCPLGCE